MSGEDGEQRDDWPRRRLRVPAKELTTILALLITLIGVLALRQSCASSVGNLFRQFEVGPDAGRVVPRPDLRAPPPPAPAPPASPPGTSPP